MALNIETGMIEDVAQLGAGVLQQLCHYPKRGRGLCVSDARRSARPGQEFPQPLSAIADYPVVEVSGVLVGSGLPSRIDGFRIAGGNEKRHLNCPVVTHGHVRTMGWQYFNLLRRRPQRYTGRRKKKEWFDCSCRD